MGFNGQGAQGAQGFQGTAGGAQGFQGASGAQGVQGTQGFQGAGANQNLAQVLGIGTSTGNLTMTSIDGNSFLGLIDGSFNLEFDDIGLGLATYVYGDTTSAKLLFFINGDGGYYEVSDVFAKISHSAKIIFSAPVVNIANIPTSPVGLSSGDIWSNLGILTIV
jgi:hypothetical protein